MYSVILEIQLYFDGVRKSDVSHKIENALSDAMYADFYWYYASQITRYLLINSVECYSLATSNLRSWKRRGELIFDVVLFQLRPTFLQLHRVQIDGVVSGRSRFRSVTEEEAVRLPRSSQVRKPPSIFASFGKNAAARSTAARPPPLSSSNLVKANQIVLSTNLSRSALHRCQTIFNVHTVPISIDRTLFLPWRMPQASQWRRTDSRCLYVRK
jgi:hypothetical protein